MAISAYRVAGGSEERGNALMGSSSSSSSSNTASRNRQDVTIPTDFQRKIQSAFLDGLYAFLDGLVHVAFSDPETIYSSPSGTKRRGLGIEADDDTGRPKEVDIRNVVRRRSSSQYSASEADRRHRRTSASS
jgi:exocyst complex component 2